MLKILNLFGIFYAQVLTLLLKYHQIVGDPIEANAIGRVYGEGRLPENKCIIGSLKSNMGHMEAAAGVAGLIKTALCLYYGSIPPSIFQKPNSKIRFDELPSDQRKFEILSNTDGNKWGQHITG